jgi:serum/glucocorticoid-regulated kinase 2
VQNFDETFLEMRPVVNDPNDVDDATDTDRGEHTETDAERTDGESAAVTPSQSRSPSVHPEDDSVDVFDGYSFKGRHSVIIDDEEESGEDTEEEAEGVAVSEQVAEPEQAAAHHPARAARRARGGDSS